MQWLSAFLLHLSGPPCLWPHMLDLYFQLLSSYIGLSVLSCRTMHLCIPPIFINPLLSLWHLLKLKNVYYIQIFDTSLQKMSLMSHTSGHMAPVICTEMLEAAAIALKDVIKQSIVKRLKNAVPCFTQNTVLCYVTINNQLINAI